MASTTKKQEDVFGEVTMDGSTMWIEIKISVSRPLGKNQERAMANIDPVQAALVVLEEREKLKK